MANRLLNTLPRSVLGQQGGQNQLQQQYVPPDQYDPVNAMITGGMNNLFNQGQASEAYFGRQPGSEGIYNEPPYEMAMGELPIDAPQKVLPLLGKMPSLLSKGAARAVQNIKPTQRVKFAENLGDDSKRVVNWYDNHRGSSAIHQNTKTGLSVDFSTNCPKRADITKGPCPYCYVEHGRKQKELFNMHGANKAIGEYPYNDDILKWPHDLVQELNQDGGLRMFSFGDYRPAEDFENVSRVLTDAQQRGLNIKAITKQPEFVETFGNHPNLRINISTDNVPKSISSNAPSIDDAIRLQAGRENIKVRAVALNEAEADMFAADDRIDVVTLYHGLTNFDSKGNRTNKLFKIVKDQNPQMVEKVGEKPLIAYLDTWTSFKPNSKRHSAMSEKYPNKVCCQGGKCSKDKAKCGFGAFGGLLLGGIFLPEMKDDD